MIMVHRQGNWAMGGPDGYEFLSKGVYMIYGYVSPLFFRVVNRPWVMIFTTGLTGSPPLGTYKSASLVRVTIRWTNAGGACLENSNV